MFYKKKYNIVIIIPSYNEKKNIKRALKKLIGKYDIIIIDDGSNDGTNFEYIKNKKTHILKHKNNLGYDSALTTGFKFAYKMRYDYAISYDADNQFYKSDIRRIIKLMLSKDYSLIIGERKNKQRIGEVMSGILFNLRFNIRDPFCGLKIYKLKDLNKKKFFELEKNNFYGLQFLSAFINKRNYESLQIRTKQRIGKTKLKNSIFVNFKMIYATFFLLLKH